MTHTNAEMTAHAQELADQMRALLPEPAETKSTPVETSSSAEPRPEELVSVGGRL